MQNIESPGRILVSFFSALVVLSGVVLPSCVQAESIALGVVTPPPQAQIRITPAGQVRAKMKRPKTGKNKSNHRAASRSAGKTQNKQKRQTIAKVTRPPQDELGNMSKSTIAPGVVYSCHRGALNINILDVDMQTANVDVKPILAGESFNRLDEVKNQAQRVDAIAAVNANYFKKDGTPLGTLIVDGEWIAGPLYDRISLGLAEDGQVHIDRMNLHGTIETSNPDVPSLWVNNINQPRRTGSKLIVYTRRWGNVCRMAYPGTLIAVDRMGQVVDKSTQQMTIPYGGFVLSDSAKSSASKLNRGDLVFLQWHPRPNHWGRVVQAVSGGPTLIREGQLYVDLQSQRFKKNWTSSSIHARTAVGLTADKHLILVTVEGPHTLWDVAKMLRKLGCVEAMNLDGGGSTTMVIGDRIVTRNKDSHQRRVATSLAILPRRAAEGQPPVASSGNGYVPWNDLTDMGQEVVLNSQEQDKPLDRTLGDPLANNAIELPVKSTDVIGLVSEMDPRMLPVGAERSSITECQDRQKKRKTGKSAKWWSHLLP